MLKEYNESKSSQSNLKSEESEIKRQTKFELLKRQKALRNILLEFEEFINKEKLNSSGKEIDYPVIKYIKKNNKSFNYIGKTFRIFKKLLFKRKP